MRHVNYWKQKGVLHMWIPFLNEQVHHSVNKVQWFSVSKVITVCQKWNSLNIKLLYQLNTAIESIQWSFYNTFQDMVVCSILCATGFTSLLPLSNRSAPCELTGPKNAFFEAPQWNRQLLCSQGLMLVSTFQNWPCVYVTVCQRAMALIAFSLTSLTFTIR